MFETAVYRAVARPAEEDRERERRAARPFAIHLGALVATKTADGLIDPKIVLAWLLGAVGAPAAIVGALVPVREAGALVPQLALARRIEARTVRKVFWAGGSFVQGLAALAIAAACLALEGAAAGWAALAGLAVLATARAACSASHKDVLARTLPKGLRGTVSGAAGTAAGAVVFLVAGLLAVGALPREPAVVAGAIAAAGALWMAGAALFLRLDEPPDPEPGSAEPDLSDLAEPLYEDGELRTYLAVRALLIPTALAPPFLVMLSGADGASALGNLGALMIASAAAGIASSYLWGRISDRSSRRTMIAAGVIASVTLGAAAATGLATGGLGGVAAASAFVFLAQIAYEGARAGRKTHLTDMATGGRKAVYTALSNTLIGALLLAGGLFGALADLAGPAVVLAVFSGLALAGAVIAVGLSEVQQEADRR